MSVSLRDRVVRWELTLGAGQRKPTPAVNFTRIVSVFAVASKSVPASYHGANTPKACSYN